MLKKVFTATLLSVSTLSVMAAHATVPGVYVTGQLGYANTHMEKIPLGKKYDSNNLDNSGLAGRLAVGYQFNQNFAVELGYLQLGQKKASSADDENYTSHKLSQYTLDLAAKGMLALSDKFNVYAKLGVAYLTRTITTRTKLNFHGFNLTNINHNWAPEAALGASYKMTPNISVDGSWTHIHPLENKGTANIDFVAVGLSYNFG